MGFVQLSVQLSSAGKALDAQRDVQKVLQAHLPECYQPFSGDIEVEIQMHSGECSVDDCGREPGQGPFDHEQA